jgi:hypothetical protein
MEEVPFAAGRLNVAVERSRLPNAATRIRPFHPRHNLNISSNGIHQINVTSLQSEEFPKNTFDFFESNRPFSPDTD